MPGNVYGRKMFRMANGGMMPPIDPAMMAGAGAPMPPAMMAGAGAPMPPAMMAGAGAPMDPAMMAGAGAPMSAADLPPEVLQAADQEMRAATDEMMAEGVQQEVGREVDRSINNLDAATDFRDIMNVVWDGDADIEFYRSKLAEVVGPEDARLTPASVLALVQPTLQLAEIDTGIGALIQEELAEVGGMEGVQMGGIADLAAKSAVADGMAAETGALVNTVGNMSNGGGSMDDMMMAVLGGGMAPGPVPMDQGPMPMAPGPVPMDQEMV